VESLLGDRAQIVPAGERRVAPLGKRRPVRGRKVEGEEEPRAG
jgi:hypothetical protein